MAVDLTGHDIGALIVWAGLDIAQAELRYVRHTSDRVNLMVIDRYALDELGEHIEMEKTLNRNDEVEVRI